MKPRLAACGLLALMTIAPLTGCLSIKTEHEIKPIEININVTVKMERELNDFFNDLDAKDKTIENKPAAADK